MTDQASVVNNTERHRFELRDGELVSRLVYRIEGNVIDLLHTEVPRPLEGRGIAHELTRAALEFAASNELLVRPTCPFVTNATRRARARGQLDRTRPCAASTVAWSGPGSGTTSGATTRVQRRPRRFRSSSRSFSGVHFAGSTR